MATQLQIRRGTSAQVAAFTGAEGEIVVNTTNDSVHVNDGSTAGGFEMARVDGSNWAITNAISTTANISFGDNDKAIFGAGSDLQIYHDGSNSYIAEAGTGDLRIRGANVEIQTGGGNKYFQGSANVARLYHTNNEKLATSGAGIAVTGTVVSDGATIAGTLELNSNKFNHTALTPSYNFIESDVTGENTQFLQASGTLRIRTVDDSGSNVAERLRVDHSTGDISFYEDTGTTPKFFWDSSAESLGIGTTSPSTKLTVFGTGVGNATVQIEGEGGADPFINFLANNTQHWSLGVDDSDADKFKLSEHSALGTNDYFVVDVTGNVGIGMSPTTNSISKSISLVNGGSIFGYGASTYITGNSNYNGAWNTVATGPDSRILLDGNVVFSRSSSASAGSQGTVSESARITSDGNLLVGKTAPTISTTGVELRPNGQVFATQSGNYPLLLNRTTSDGDIAQFRKDGTTVGSIGAAQNSTYIGGSGNGAIYFNGQVDVRPWNKSTQANLDNIMDLGSSSSRWDDIYATNGTIQTSDRNEKQDIAELSDAEQRVAVAAKGLLRKFRWISSVEENGDDARIHFGIIAQDLQDAFTAEGLDAGRYAMFISSTWTDDDGNEQTRLGVRYSELLAFIISAI